MSQKTQKTALPSEIADSAVYTREGLADRLNVSPQWVDRHIIKPGCRQQSGCPCLPLGRNRLISGRQLRLWVERQVENLWHLPAEGDE